MIFFYNTCYVLIYSISFCHLSIEIESLDKQSLVISNRHSSFLTQEISKDRLYSVHNRGSREPLDFPISSANVASSRAAPPDNGLSSWWPTIDWHARPEVKTNVFDQDDPATRQKRELDIRLATLASHFSRPRAQSRAEILNEITGRWSTLSIILWKVNVISFSLFFEKDIDSLILSYPAEILLIVFFS